MADQFLTTGAVAKRFGVTSSTIREWVERGHLPYLRLPSGQLRFREDAVDEAVANMRPGAGGSAA